MWRLLVTERFMVSPFASLADRACSVLDAQTIDTGRRVVEHRGALRGRVALRESLEGVVHDAVGEGNLVHGEVALEHAATRTELLDAVAHAGRHGGGQLLRADGSGPGVPVEAGARHAHAAQLDVDVGTGRYRGDTAPPLGEHLVVATGVGPGPEQATDVVQDDGEIRYRPREVGQLR